MKKLILAAILSCACAFSMAQSAFTIVRPADGSKVRENVSILFPKDSVPQGGYVGIFVGGKFIEATVPRVGQTYCEYVLKTKDLNLPEGTVTVEAVLYVDFNERPRIIDRSSIDLQIANVPNIPIPANGFNLKYAFTEGNAWTYHLINRVFVGSITEDRIQKGGREAILQVDSEAVRLEYAVDNKYGNGDALLRMQALTDKGENRVFLTTSNDQNGRWYYQREMHPVYMRVRSTGLEVFGAVPQYFPMSGAPSMPPRTDLYAVFPLPTLPTRPIQIGDTWQGRFQMGNLNLANMHAMTSLTEKIPARGEFLGVEWEAGRPCAKIRHSFSMGRDQAGPTASNVAKIEETIWFALDKSVVVKMIREITYEQKVDSEGQILGAGGQPAGGGAPTTPRGRLGTPGAGAPAAGAGAGGRGGAAGAGDMPGMDNTMSPATPGSLNQARRGRGQQAPAASRVGNPNSAAPTAVGRRGAIGRPSTRNAEPPKPVITILRRTFQQIFTLEQ